MDLSLIGKIGLIFKYIFSSFLSLETFIISLLLLVILILNQRKNNFITQLVAVSIFLGFIIMTITIANAVPIAEGLTSLMEENIIKFFTAMGTNGA